VQFVALAVLGEYVVRTHRHTQRRPLFVVDTVIENLTPTCGYRIVPNADSEVTLACQPSALCSE
jgi:hypothetical protein